jgi:hypothetical protein
MPLTTMQRIAACRKEKHFVCIHEAAKDGISQQARPCGVRVPQVRFLNLGFNRRRVVIVCPQTLLEELVSNHRLPGTIGRVRGSAPRYAATPITTSAPATTPSFNPVAVRVCGSTFHSASNNACATVTAHTDRPAEVPPLRPFSIAAGGLECGDRSFGEQACLKAIRRRHAG